MSKINKIFFVIVMVAGVLCLAIGTVFAVDFVEEHPDVFGCNSPCPVVASLKPFVVPPVVEPLSDFVIYPDDISFAPSIMEYTEYLGDWNFVPSGTYLLTFNYTSSAPSFSVNIDVDDVGTLSLLSVNAGNTSFSSSVSAFTLLYSDYTSVFISFEEGILTADFNTFDGQLYTITGNIRSFEFRLNGAFGFFLDGSSAYVDLDVGTRSYQGVLSSVVDTLVSGLRSLGANVGRAFSTMANAIFINSDGTGLSTFGILVVVFAAVSLGLSLTRWVLNFCSSWGKRNR